MPEVAITAYLETNALKRPAKRTRCLKNVCPRATRIAAAISPKRNCHAKSCQNVTLNAVVSWDTRERMDCVYQERSVNRNAPKDVDRLVKCLTQRIVLHLRIVLTADTAMYGYEDTKKCIKINQCTYGKGCNGDKNAYIREHPPPCPAVCKDPNETPCKKLGLDVGCVCNAGYILDKEGGTCIKPSTCPGGNPCGANSTFACCKLECPSEYCPTDGRQGRAVCDPQIGCPAGCICNIGYVWKSQQDKTCILAQDCPELPCKGKNEKWDKCPCSSDDCSYYPNSQSECKKKTDCYPQCRCKTGYARDRSVCILGKDCPADYPDDYY